MIKVAIMASGKGSNALNLINYLKPFPHVKVHVLICDNPKAEILKTAKAKVSIHLVERKQNTRQDHEKDILEILENYEINWVLLAGYQRVLSPYFLKKFWDQENSRYQIINIHPSLLPQFPGREAYKQVFESEVTQTGVTVHFVDAGVDTGPIICQQSFTKDPHETLEQLIHKGKNIEHLLYPQALEQVWNL